MHNNILARKTERTNMEQQISGITIFSPDHIIEMPEVKKPQATSPYNDNLSEFERARRTNKTWSMGQD